MPAFSGIRLRAVLALCAVLSTGCLGSRVPAAAALAAPPTPGTGIHVANGRILEANGADFVMRGIDWGHDWYPTQTQQAFSDMKAAGANSVRVVLSGGRYIYSTPADIAVVVARCRQLKLICILEDHDTTAGPGAGKQATLSEAADYWIAVKNALVGEDPYIVINIGNEPLDSRSARHWTRETMAAVLKLRAAGIHLALMVDAPDFGQDLSFTMRDDAGEVLRADPDHNVIFDIHMYNVFGTSSAVTSYMDSFVRRKLPLVVGEFGWKSEFGDIDERAILDYGQQRGIGWMPWSWSGNEPKYLDMVTNFDATKRTPYGDEMITGKNGLFATSKEATVYALP